MVSHDRRFNVTAVPGLSYIIRCSGSPLRTKAPLGPSAHAELASDDMGKPRDYGTLAARRGGPVWSAASSA